MPSTYNLFIRKDDPVRNAPNSQALADTITRQMGPCHVALIMAGVYASYSTWIQRKIRIAKNSFESPKPIVAIKPRGNVNVSELVSSNPDRFVGWNTDSIVEAIRDLA